MPSMPENTPSNDAAESIPQIVEVLRYLILRDKGMRRGTEAQRKAQATVDALVKQYEIPPLIQP
jgi:hypothetical protein